MADSLTIFTMKLAPKLRYHYDNEVFINYDKVGEGSNPLIFLHGFSLSLYSWDDVIKSIDRSTYTIYRLDLKGFGFSYKGDKGTYSVEEQAEIVAAFIKHFTLTNSTLIAHSYGGMVALNLLYINATKQIGLTFKKLILLDTPGFSDAEPFFLKALRNPILNFISLQILPSRINASFTIKNTFYNSSIGLKKYLNTYNFFFDLPGSRTTMTLAAKNIYPANIDALTGFYSEINIPTLILWGKNDKLIPLSNGEKLQNAINKSTLIVIDECGHVPNEEKPDQTAQYIIEFLSK